MLKKRNRFSRREFVHLLKHGRRVHGEGVTVVYEKLAAGSLQLAENPQTTSTSPPPSPIRGGGDGRTTTYNLQPTTSHALRAGVVVGKKVARNAVDRNTLRRAIYKVLGEVLDLAQPLCIAVLTRPIARTMTQDEMRKEIVTLLARCGDGN